MIPAVCRGVRLFKLGPNCSEWYCRQWFKGVDDRANRGHRAGNLLEVQGESCGPDLEGSKG